MSYPRSREGLHGNHILATFSVGKCPRTGREEVLSPYLPQRHDSYLRAIAIFHLT